MTQRAMATTSSMLPKAMGIVPYLTPEDVQQMAQACQGRNKDRGLAHRLKSYAFDRKLDPDDRIF